MNDQVMKRAIELRLKGTGETAPFLAGFDVERGCHKMIIDQTLRGIFVNWKASEAKQFIFGIFESLCEGGLWNSHHTRYRCEGWTVSGRVVLLQARYFKLEVYLTKQVFNEGLLVQAIGSLIGRGCDVR